jgi:hypothetical protein
MVGEEEAHVEQITPEEHEAHEEAPEEQERSLFEDDGDKEGALQGEGSSYNSRSTTS